MTRNKLGLPARSLMVAVAVVCGIPADALHGQVLSAPTNLTATPLSATSIELTWTPSTSAVTGYRIETSPTGSGSTWTLRRNTGVTNSYTDSDRDPGTTLYYRVAAINGEERSAYSNVVRGTTRGSTGTAGAPGNLSAVAPGPTIIDLSWDEPSLIPTGKTISGYQVDMSTDGGINFTRLTSTVQTSYRHSGLTAGTTRHYRVRALYSDNTPGPWTSTQHATTPATGIPGAPQNLTATAAGPSAINLGWDAPSSNGGSAITGYRIEWSADGGNPWRFLVTTSQTNYQHTGLTAGTTRHYRVRAENAANRSGPWTDTESATTTAGIPGVPRNLTARAVGGSAIDLEWTAPASVAGSAPVTGYNIEWSADGSSSWTPLVRNHNDTGYRHDGLDPGTTRYYRVAAVNRHGRGPWTEDRVSATTSRLPGRPTRLTAEAQGPSEIELNWTAPSLGGGSITGYRIEWSSTGRSRWQSLVANTRNARTTYTDTRLDPGTTRYYRVAAINSAGTGPWSDDASATTEVTVPGAPTSLRATAPIGVEGSTQIRLTWRPPSSNGGSPITGYRIEWAVTRGGPWRFLVPGPTGTATTYLHTGLAPNTTRFYRVRALNAEGQGDPSNAIPGKTNAAPPTQPRNLRARATGPTSITLAWEAPAGDGGERITGYTIQARGPSDGNWITIPRNTGSTATTFEHTGLQPATAYRYRVAAINRVGTGQWSFEASTSTYAQAPGAPVGLTARAVGTSRIDLSWSAPRNTGGAPIFGYRIEASDDQRRTWRIVRRSTNSKGTTFSDVNLQPATTRYYRVAAINTAGTGPYSNFTSATTEATVPGAPRSLDAEPDGTSRIELSWLAPTRDGGSRITGYRIEVSEDGGTRWTDLVTNSHNTRTTYVHTGLEPATRQHYRVSAINRIGVSRASRVASAITDATVPDAPTGLVATDVSPTQIDLFWLAPAYDGGAPVTGYRIEVSENGTAWTDLVVNTGSRATTFSHTELLPGSVRHYRVSAINRVGAGAASASASAQTDDPIGRAGRLNTRVLPHVAAAMTSSTVSAIARRVDAVANGMGMERRVETNGLSSMAASLSAPDAGGLGLAQGDQAGLAALFGGTSFTMPFGAPSAPQQSATGTQLASWGAGEYHHLGEPGQSALDWKGNMVSAHAGIDARVGPDILAGVAGSYSSGSFDFTDKTGASPVRGTYGTTMASVHPYLAWFSGAGAASVWGSAGLGRGDIEVDDAREGLRTSPASLLTGAGGASYRLLTRDAGGVRLMEESLTEDVLLVISRRDEWKVNVVTFNK